MCISKAIRWTLAAVAAVAVAAGCGAPARHTQAHERVGVTALVHPIDYFSTSGNDGTCRRGLRSRPCLTLDRACTLSRSGDFIVKIGGSRWARSTGCLVHLTQPSIAGATLFSTTALSASCGFASGISCTTVNYLVDGGQVCTSSTGPAFSCTWDTTSVANGTHTVQASATTSSGTRVSIAFNETVANSSGTSLANLWMSPTGTAAPGTGHCVWSASLIADPDTGTGTTLCGPVKDAIAAAGNNPGIVGMVPGVYAAQNPSAPYTSSRTVTSGTCDTTVNRPGGWVTSENLSGCLTFQPADGGTPLSSEVTINGAVNAYSSGIRFLNITITNGAFGTNWRNGLGGTPCSGPKPHDIIFDGIRNYVPTVPVPGASPPASFNFNSTDNYSVLNSEIGPTYDGQGTAQSQDYQASSTTSAACGALTQAQINSSNGNIVGNYLHDDPVIVTTVNAGGVTTVNGNQTVAPGGQLAVNGVPAGWPNADFICDNAVHCGSAWPTGRFQYSALGANTITLVAGGTFADGDTINIQDCGGQHAGPPSNPSDNLQFACNHAEAIHWRASNGNILSNRFTNDGQYDVNLQTFPLTGNGTINATAVVGNVMDQPCSNQPTLYGAQTPLGVNDRLCGTIAALRFICNGGTDTITNAIDAWNTVWGDNEFQLGCAAGTPFAGSALYGNLQSGINLTACNWFKNNGGVSDFNFRTTENSGVACQNNDVASTSTFQSLVTNPLPTTYDFTLAGTLGTAFAPCSATVNGQTIVAPAFAIDGTPRPTGASLCSAGAYEVATGASLATCTSGTCTEGALPSANFSNSCTATPSGAFAASGTGWGVKLGQISDGIGTECRDYLAYVPVGLTGAAPLLVYGHGSNSCPDNAQFSDIAGNTLDALANTNRLVVLMLGMPHPCTSRPPSDPSVPACSALNSSFCQWFHHEADIPDVGPTPQDYTYIQAAIADIESRLNGGNPTFPGVTIDTKRIWYMGQSTGGGLATGIACNDATSSLFRGIAYDGLGYNEAVSGGLPVSGSERCGGGGEPLATNKKFFFSQVLAGSNTGTAFNGSCAAGTHCIPSWTEVKSHLSAYFGCPAPTVTFVGSPSAVNENDTYNSCGYGLSPQVQGWVVVGAGDGYDTAAGKNGWVTQNILDFFNNSKWTGP